MNIFILNIQYHPNNGPVACLCEDEFGLGQFYINLRQEDLPANWGDDDVLAAAQRRLDTDPGNEFPKLGRRGHTLAFPAPAPEPAPAPAIGETTEELGPVVSDPAPGE